MVALDGVHPLLSIRLIPDLIQEFSDGVMFHILLYNGPKILFITL